MDANAHPGPPAARRNVTTRAKLRIALGIITVVLEVVALVLLSRSHDVINLAALRQQHIAQCLVGLGILCIVFSMLLTPSSPMTPHWAIPAGVALAVLMLALVLNGLTLYAFFFPSAAGLAATMMVVAGVGILADMLLAVLVFGTNRRRIQAR